MDMRGNPNAPANPYAPTNYSQNRNPFGNLGNQQTLGQMAPQPNTAGLGLGIDSNRMPGMQMPAPAYNPPVSIPTGEVPPVYHGGTAAPPIPSYAVPGGRQPGPNGMTSYTNPTTGLTSWGPGNAWQAAPSGSGVAFQPRQQFPMLQGLQGFGQHQQGGFNPDHLRRMFGGY